jgi:hypothetical protein
MTAPNRLWLALALVAACGDDGSASDTADAADADTTADSTADASAELGPDGIAEPDSADVIEADLGPDATVEDRFAAVVAPAAPAGGLVPILVHALDDSGNLDASVSGTLVLVLGDERLDLRMRRGVGSITATMPSAAADLRLESGGELAQIEVLDGSVRSVEGTLQADDLAWDATQLVVVTGGLTIPAGLTLEVGEGTRVELAAGANIIVQGAIEVNGTASAPVVFASRDDAAWGGLVVDGAATLDFAMLVNAGGDGSRAFGHSGSQPVVFGESATVTIRDSVIQDSPGKAMGAHLGSWTLERNLVTRTDTGGEFEHAELTLRDSHYFDFPSIDATPRDDDNDAIYLLGDPADESPPQITIANTTFVGGADDGIDHNGSTIDLAGSWIEDFDHECIAASSGGSVDVHDTALVACEQGLEAGYGAPDVRGTHLLIMSCDVGLRFGDSYEREYTGHLDVRDSVVVDSAEHAVWNHSFATDSAVAGAVEVHTSVLDGDGEFEGAGNVVDRAELGSDLLLVAGSPGDQIAGDGLDPGLLTPRPR